MRRRRSGAPWDTVTVRGGRVRVGLAVALLAIGIAPAAGAGLAMDPAAACALLGDQGLATRDGYRERQRGLFECASIPHRWPPGATTDDEVRFVASGARGRVSQLRLELSLRSRGDVRAVLAAFARLADTLSGRAFGQPLPTEARGAVAAGIVGTWRGAGGEVALERIAGSVPALRLIWR
jgi:hypothetical protein